MKATLKNITETSKKTDNGSMGAIIARNLQFLSKQSGVSEAEIARTINCPPQTLNRIFRGQMQDPKISILRKLSYFFEIPISNLLSENLSFGLENYTMLPILEWEELSEANQLEVLLKNNHQRHWQPIISTVSDNAFLLKSTKSMAPRFPYVTLFVIEPNIQPVDGDIVIVHFHKNDIYTARELIIDAPQWILQNVTGDDKSYYERSEHKIVGVVIEKRFIQGR